MRIYVLIVISRTYPRGWKATSIRSGRKEALKKRDELTKSYGLTDEDKPNKAPSVHSEDCRWNDDDEVHMHGLDLHYLTTHECTIVDIDRRRVTLLEETMKLMIQVLEERTCPARTACEMLIDVNGVMR